MRFKNSTTSDDLRIEFLTSVAKLDREMEERYDRVMKAGGDQLLLATHTRKMILQWFFDNGGM